MKETISLEFARANDLSHYFTGKPCKRGHIANRLTKSRRCLDCCAQYRRDEWKNHHEREIQKSRKQWALRKNDPEIKRKAIDRAKAYYQENRDSRIEFAKNYYQKTKKYQNDLQKIREAEDPEKFFLKRKHAKAVSKVQHDSYMNLDDLRHWASLKDKCCRYCHVECAEDYQIDHVIPLSSGGKHEASNLAICCRSCNSSKGAKTLDDFMIYRSLKPLSK